MIRLDNITLTFPDGDNRVTAVNQVSLTAHPGTVTGITGPSGSGKSSLLAVAATLIRPDSGQVIIDDIDATRLTPAEATETRRNKIGIVFQQSNLIPSLTAREQLSVMNESAHAAHAATAATRPNAPRRFWMRWDSPNTETNDPTSSPEVNASE